MPTTLSFKDIIDKPEWRPLANKPAVNAVGQYAAWDLRNNGLQDPFIWNLASTTTLEKYLVHNDEWITTAAFTAIGGAIAAGSGNLFVPSHGPAGAVGGSPTSTSFTLAALPNSASVAINQLANRGDKVGFRIRVMAKGAGHSGVTEERTIIANTAGATPIITLDSALSFVPTATDSYEILSGRVYLLGSGAATALGYWKAYDVATGTISGNLSITNLAAAIATDFCAVSQDESYVPHNMKPGDGMILGGATYNGAINACIQASASNGTTITGGGMPAGLLTDEFKNYQIRIVEDAVTPTSVGQRKRVTTHTSGASGVFTVASWSVQPSSSAKFVIENNNDLLLWTNAATVTYSYAAGGYAADANWSTAAVAGGAFQYANPAVAMGAGCMAELMFSIVPDTAKNARNSRIIWFRGAATGTLYYLDIATNTWTAIANYGNIGQTFTTGACCCLDPATNEGRYLYIVVNATQRIFRFDLLNMVMEPWGYLRYAAGTAVVGGKLTGHTFIDGATKVGLLYMSRSSGAEFFDIILQR